MHSPRSSHRRRTTAVIGWALSFAFGAVFVTSVVTAATASAHTSLLAITPTAGEQLTIAPTEVVLRFDEPVSTSFVKVVVTDASVVSATSGKPTVEGNTVRQALVSDLGPGRYRIAYQVVSDDGHPVSGESTFTLTLTTPTSASSSAPVGFPTASQSPSTALPGKDSPAADHPQEGQGGWPAPLPLLVAGGLGVLVVGAGVLRRQRQ